MTYNSFDSEKKKFHFYILAQNYRNSIYNSLAPRKKIFHCFILVQNCCNSTYNSLAPRKIFEHINELWCRTIVSKKCNGNPRTDNNNRQISHVMRKPMFNISGNKCTDQLHTNKEADQHLYFHYSYSNFQYSDSSIPLLSKSKIYSIKAILQTMQIQIR